MSEPIPAAEQIGELVIDTLYGRVNGRALQRAVAGRLSLNPYSVEIEVEIDTSHGAQLTIRVPMT